MKPKPTPDTNQPSDPDLISPLDASFLPAAIAHARSVCESDVIRERLTAASRHHRQLIEEAEHIEKRAKQLPGEINQSAVRLYVLQRELRASKQRHAESFTAAAEAEQK